MPERKRALFVYNHKGGTGKSTFARALVESLRASGHTVGAYDADGSVGQLLQFEGRRDPDGKLLDQQDPIQGCAYFDVRSDGKLLAANTGRDMLLAAASSSADSVVFDMPAGAINEISELFDGGLQPDALVREYRNVGFAVTVIIVITPIRAAVRMVQNTIRLFGAEVDYVVVKNLFYGDEDEFFIFDGIDTPELTLAKSAGKQLLEDACGHVVCMPSLKQRTYTLLDLHSVRFVDADTDKRIPPPDRSRVRQWLHEYRRCLAPAERVLGFAEVHKPALENPPPLSNVN